MKPLEIGKINLLAALTVKENEDNLFEAPSEENSVES